MALIRGFCGLAARVLACAAFAVPVTESAAHGQTPISEPTNSAVPVTAPPAGAPSPAPAQPAPQAPAAKAPERRVDIDAYDVDGNTILDEESIESAVYPFLGPERSRDDVEGARKALEHAYQSRGYQSVVVEIPPQTVTNGIVKLHVVEAPIGRLRVVGSKYNLPSTIKSQVPALAAGTVPNIQTAQAELNDVNRLPDRRVTPILKPGQVPGTIDVDLHVTDTLPLHASAEVNNDHSPNTDPLRTVATVHYDNLWQEGHSASFTWLRAPENVHSGQVFSGSYLAPLWGSPWNVLVYGYDSNSDVNTLGGTNVLGDGYSVGTRGVLQLPSFDDFTQTFSFGLDFKHFLEGITFGTSGSTTTVDYWPVSAAYNLNWVTSETQITSQSSIVLGTRGLGSPPPEFQNNRAFATGNFIHLNEDITLTQKLPFDTLGVFHFAGQIADQPLLSSEEFAAGGLTSVRGYLQSEAIGDDGLLASNELRSPSLTKFLSPYLDMSAIDDWRVFAFADLAHVWILGSLPGQTDAFTLESFGAGMRIGALGHLTGLIDIGIPIRTGPATPARKPRLTFSVKSEM